MGLAEALINLEFLERGAPIWIRMNQDQGKIFLIYFFYFIINKLHNYNI